MTNAPRHTHPDDTTELLSSYLDDALDVVERRRVDSLLRDCAACAADLQDLRSLRRLLRELPAPLPRRSFTLDPATARPRRRLFPIFRFASLAAALLLFVVLGIDALGRGRSGTEAGTAAQAPAAESAPAPGEPMLFREGATTEAPAIPEQPVAGGAAEDAPEQATPAAGAPAAPTEVAEAARTQATIDAPMAEALAAPTQAQGADAPAQAATAAAGAAPAAATEEAATAAETLDESVPTAAQPPEAPPPVAQDQIEPEAAVQSSSVLTEDDTAAADTTTLEDRQTAFDRPGGPATFDAWRVAELILAMLVAGLGAATWWTARRRL